MALMRSSLLALGVLVVCAAGCATAGAAGSVGPSMSDGKVFEARFGSAEVKVPLPAGWYVAKWEPRHVILSRREVGGIALNPTIEILVEPGTQPYEQEPLTALQARRVLGHLGGEVVVPSDWAPLQKLERGIAGTGSLRAGGKYHDLRWRFYGGEVAQHQVALASLCAPQGELACDAEFDQMLQALKVTDSR